MMKQVEKCTLLALISALWGLALSVEAAFYQNSLGISEWQVSGGELQCSLKHTISNWGEVSLVARAGQGDSWQFQPDKLLMPSGEYWVQAVKPLWRSSTQAEPLGQFEFMSNKLTLPLTLALGQQILVSLESGKSLLLTHQSQAIRPWRLKVDSLNFSPAYTKFRRCKNKMITLSFAQAERTRLFFSDKSAQIDANERKKLDELVRFIKADKNLKSIYIDGHADNRGDALNNLEVSKKRAQWVADHLVAKGIAKEKVLVRWHGDKYPVAKNSNQEGRAKNRRVTLRLARETAITHIQKMPNSS